MAKPKHDALIFIDTNVFLDYYRVRGDTGTLSLLKHVDTHRQQIITTGQVEMEFKKNRQRVILESLKNLKAPEWASLTAPPFLAEPRAIGILRRHRTSTEQQVRKMQTQIERVLRNPAQHDTVYAITQRLFKAESPYNLDRSKDSAADPISRTKAFFTRVPAAKGPRSVSRRRDQLRVADSLRDRIEMQTADHRIKGFRLWRSASERANPE
jgi:predicted nucleic acid-binding protein